jgi:hypothetical protein
LLTERGEKGPQRWPDLPEGVLKRAETCAV